MLKSNPLLVLATAVGLFAVVSRPVFGHHGKDNYDVQHPVTLSGTVTAYDFLNPHVLIRFDVTDANGATSKWIAEGDPPQKLYRAGWRRDSLKPGDKITITGPPDKGGGHTLVLQKLEVSDGRTFGPAPEL